MKHDFNFMDRINHDLAARKAARSILGVEENASIEDLKKAYRKAARQYHPDHNENTEQSNRKFLLIKCAYELLAFDTPCDLLLTEMDSWFNAPKDEKFDLSNEWGHFCWWREKFLGDETDKKKHDSNGRSCI